MNSCYRVYAYDVTGNISTHANYVTGVGGFWGGGGGGGGGGGWGVFAPPPPPPPPY